VIFSSAKLRPVVADPTCASASAPPGAKWPFLAVAAIAASFFYLHLFRFPFLPIWHNGDQAIFLEHADRMLRGDVLYRDLFQLNLPGTEYLYYFLFRGFGVRLWIEPLVLLITEASITVLLYSLSRMVLRGVAAFFPAAAYLLFCQGPALDGTHHWYSTLLVLLAILLVATARSLLPVCFAGALLGLATVFTSSRGVFVAAGVCLFFVWKYRGWRGAYRAIIALLAPLSIIVASVLAYLATIAGPKALLDSVVVFPLRYWSASPWDKFSAFYFEWSYVLPLRLESIWIVTGLFAATASVPLIFIAFAVRYGRWRAFDLRDSSRGETLVLCASAGLFAFLAVASAPTSLRLACAASFAYILGTALFYDLRLHLLISPVLAVVGLVACAQALHAATRPIYRLDGPRGSLAFRDPERYDSFVWVAQNARPGDRIFGAVEFNFILGLANPSSVQSLERDAFTRPEQIQTLLAALHRHPTRFIVWSSILDGSDGPGDNLQPLRDYLKANYHLGKRFDEGSEILVLDSTPANPHP
jgi:hypothetical protein